MYNLHEYPPDRIWNCNELGAQVGKNGGGLVIARTGACQVHSIMFDQHEWLSIHVYINAIGLAIPSFYIFRSKRFGQNYIQQCEPGSMMAMQLRAWMTTYLFSTWILHFIASIHQIGDILLVHCHLFILEGHNNHVTLEVAQEAKSAGLDLITLLSHTLHAL